MRPTGGLGGRMVEREGVLLRPPRPVSEGGAGVEELEEALMANKGRVMNVLKRKTSAMPVQNMITVMMMIDRLLCATCLFIASRDRPM